MNKKYISAIFAILFLVGGCFLYSRLSMGIPSHAPTTVIKYNGTAVATSLGDFNWIPKNGGSSYETGGEYNVGLNTPKFKAKSGDTIHISVPQSPLNVRVDQMLDNNYKHIEYTPVKEGKDYTYTLPTEKGEYIFKVFANWDSDRHNTATIFRVQVE